MRATGELGGTRRPTSHLAPVRVASVPADHVYVRHLADPHGRDDVVRLPEPRRDGPEGARWWPSPLLSAEWVRAHSDDFDVAHVHFGFDGVGVDRLAGFTDALAEVGRPLVFTVHDLRNPHHVDRRAHDEALEVLATAARALVTLTPGAADELRRRFSRPVLVAPHPHVVPLERPRRPRAHPGPVTVGIHLKSVRANMATLEAVDVVADVVASRPTARLRVDVHDVVDRPGHPAHDPDLLAALRERHRSGCIDLHVHPFFADDELWDYLEAIDVSVLPYRFGTHSGWLEACADLGTAVVAPRCGWYHEQQPVHSYESCERGLGRRSLAAAVARACDHPPPEPVPPAERARQRAALAEVHRRLYRSLLP